MPQYQYNQKSITSQIEKFLNYIYRQSVAEIDKNIQQGKIAQCVAKPILNDMRLQHEQDISELKYGFCNGFSIIYLMSRFLEAKPVKGKEHVNNYIWFSKALAAIMAFKWEANEALLAQTLNQKAPQDAHSYYDYFKEFISYLKVFQRPGRFLYGDNLSTRQSVGELLEYSDGTKIISGRQEFGAIFYCDTNELKCLLGFE